MEGIQLYSVNKFYSINLLNNFGLVSNKDKKRAIGKQQTIELLNYRVL